MLTFSPFPPASSQYPKQLKRRKADVILLCAWKDPISTLILAILNTVPAGFQAHAVGGDISLGTLVTHWYLLRCLAALAS